MASQLYGPVAYLVPELSRSPGQILSSRFAPRRRKLGFRFSCLDNARLDEANLTNADLESASLRNANLRDTNLTNAILQGASLRDANLRGANLTRIESRPSNEAWSYRFFVDLIHDPGPEGLARVIDPPPATCADLWVLGSYVRAGG